MHDTTEVMNNFIQDLVALQPHCDCIKAAYWLHFLTPSENDHPLRNLWFIYFAFAFFLV